MTMPTPDPDRDAAATLGANPNLLAEIAGRRWDLHWLIAANPGAHPELVRWMRTVNPSLGQPPAAPPRRSGIGWWLAGCGCLAIALIMVVVIVIVAGSDSTRRCTVRSSPPSTHPPDARASGWRPHTSSKSHGTSMNPAPAASTIASVSYPVAFIRLDSAVVMVAASSSRNAVTCGTTDCAVARMR